MRRPGRRAQRFEGAALALDNPKSFFCHRLGVFVGLFPARSSEAFSGVLAERIRQRASPQWSARRLVGPPSRPFRYFSGARVSHGITQAELDADLRTGYRLYGRRDSGAKTAVSDSVPRSSVFIAPIRLNAVLREPTRAV